MRKDIGKQVCIHSALQPTMSDAFFGFGFSLVILHSDLLDSALKDVKKVF